MNMDYKTKYVIYGGGFEWMNVCYKDVVNRQDVLFVNSQIPYNGNNRLIKYFAKFCYGLKYSPHTYVLPFFRKFLFGFFAQKDFLKDSNEIIFIIYDQNRLDADFEFVKYLRNKYKSKLRLVYCFTNTFENSHIQNNYKLGYELKKYYDAIYSYNRDDCEKLGFNYYPLLYSFDAVNKEEVKPIYDVVFVGNGKDRLTYLHSAYELFHRNGFKCKFYIVGVPENEQLITNDEIVYNKLVTYDENIRLIKNSRCVLDVMQGGASGMNIRILETIFNGRKVITNCEVVKDNDSIKENVLVYKKIEDIDLSFINTPVLSLECSSLEMYSPTLFLNYIKHQLKL